MTETQPTAPTGKTSASTVTKPSIRHTSSETICGEDSLGAHRRLQPFKCSAKNASVRSHAVFADASWYEGRSSQWKP